MRPPAQASFRGERVGRVPPPSRAYPPGRICRSAACDTRLSIYNAEPYCWVHQPEPRAIGFGTAWTAA